VVSILFNLKHSNMKIYLDNAATTQLDPEVFSAMTPYLLEHYGNASSHHAHGREAKRAIEQARNTIANLINADPSEIIFTGGGTEADNTALLSAEGRRVITTPLEHHAVLHALDKPYYLSVNNKGEIDLAELELLLSDSVPSFVSIMHANNEIGVVNDIQAIGRLCESYGAIFHSDTVQTIGHYRHDLQSLKAHYITCSAHKFHGPKGVGFLYCRKGTNLSQLLHGGSQERKLRAGTENIAGIIGLAKAFEIACRDIDEHQQHIQGLKSRLVTKLKDLPGITFNSTSATKDSLYTVLSVNFPSIGIDLLALLDQNNISVSGGSACSTGSASHVLQAIKSDRLKDTIRFSFSKFNTAEEIDYTADILCNLFKVTNNKIREVEYSV
jgi:cysteine desulfurase